MATSPRVNTPAVERPVARPRAAARTHRARDATHSSPATAPNAKKGGAAPKRRGPKVQPPRQFTAELIIVQRVSIIARATTTGTLRVRAGLASKGATRI